MHFLMSSSNNEKEKIEIPMIWSPDNSESRKNIEGDNLGDLSDQLIKLDNVSYEVQMLGQNTYEKLAECLKSIEKLSDELKAESVNDELPSGISLTLKEIVTMIKEASVGCYYDSTGIYKKIKQLSTDMLYDVIEEQKKKAEEKARTAVITPDKSEGIWHYLGTVLEKRSDGKYVIREGSKIYFRIKEEYSGETEPEEEYFYNDHKLSPAVIKLREKIKEAATFDRIKLTNKIGDDDKSEIDEKKIKKFAIYKFENEAFPLPVEGLSTVCSTLCGYTTSYPNQKAKFKRAENSIEPLSKEEYDRLKSKYNK